MTPEQRRLEARRMHAEGMTFAAIGREIGVSAVTVRKYCRGLGLPANGESHRGRSESMQNPANNQALQAVRRAQAFDFTLAGMSNRWIAAEMGVDHRTVGRWLDEEIQNRISPRVEKLRALGNARLDSLRAVAWSIAHDVDAPRKLRLEAIDRVLNVERRWAALNGADSPVRVEAIVTERTQADLEMEELLREAQARNAVIEGQILDESVDTA